MVRWKLLRVVECAALGAALFVSACGGQSEHRSDGSNGGDGGSTVTGGSGGTSNVPTGGTSGVPTGGTSGSAGTGSPPGSCVYEGRVYASGTSFPSSDGCNTCYCDAGDIGCTLVDCPSRETCEVFLNVYPDVLAEAKRCTPGSPLACDILTASGLQCACPTFVDDSSQVDAIITRWNDYGCGRGPGVTCGACPPDPLSAYCSADGVCVESYRE